MMELVELKGERVMIADSVSNGSKTIYTVPEGRQLWIMASEIHATHYAAGDHEAYMQFAGVDVHHVAGPDAVDSYYASKSYPRGVKLSAGEAIVIWANAYTTVRGNVQGYLI
jgi:hypothetical protein